MDTDVEILNKILAKQIQQGFYIPWSSEIYREMLCCFHIQKTIDVLHHTNKIKDETMWPY